MAKLSRSSALSPHDSRWATFINNISSNYCSNEVEQDGGYMIQTIIIVATFSVVAVAVIGLIANSIMILGEEEAQCIKNSAEMDSGMIGSSCIKSP